MLLIFIQYLYDYCVNYYILVQQPTKYLQNYFSLINLKTNDYRNAYDILKRSYEKFGQFQYSDQRDQGVIEIDVENGYYVEITSRIKEKYTSIFRSITVYKEGKIEEEESSSMLRFIRKRVIHKSGFCEEYSKDRRTGFGTRRVVYEDGQKFSGEVYGCGWNAIGEEAYAIQKSIPDLFGDNEMKKYKFVSEDGSFKIIGIEGNDNEESLNLSSYSFSQESSDSDSDSLRCQESKS